MLLLLLHLFDLMVLQQVLLLLRTLRYNNLTPFFCP